jgi:hypothetical protein
MLIAPDPLELNEKVGKGQAFLKPILASWTSQNPDSKEFMD